MDRPAIGSAWRRWGFRSTLLFSALLVADAVAATEPAPAPAQVQAPSSPEPVQTSPVASSVPTSPPAATDEELEAAAAEAVFNRLDVNHDQQLSRQEFEAGLNGHRQGLVYQRLPAHFRSRDTNQNGYLEADELAVLQRLIGARSTGPTLASADSNGDAKLDFREYALLMATLDGALP
jgi:EF hand